MGRRVIEMLMGSDTRKESQLCRVWVCRVWACSFETVLDFVPLTPQRGELRWP